MNRDEAMSRHPSTYRPMREIWTPEDFEQAVRDAQAVVQAGKTSRHLHPVADTERTLRLTSVSRHRKARIYDALAVALLLALAAALGVIAVLAAAPHAKADNTASAAVLDYAATYGAGAVCPVLDTHRTVSGVMGVLVGIGRDGFSEYEAGQIVGISVTKYCPRNQPLLRQFIAVYGSTETAIA